MKPYQSLFTWAVLLTPAGTSLLIYHFAWEYSWWWNALYISLFLGICAALYFVVKLGATTRNLFVASAALLIGNAWVIYRLLFYIAYQDGSFGG
jgi:hypothetical protein